MRVENVLLNSNLEVLNQTLACTEINEIIYESKVNHIPDAFWPQIFL